MAALFEEEFDASTLASGGHPFYVRKIDRRRHWRGDETMSVDDRVKTAATQVFPSDGKISVFLVANAYDLIRVAIGLNSVGPSLNEKLELLCITPDDLKHACLQLEQSPGDTKCLHANSLHYDILDDRDAIDCLVRLLISRDHKDRRLTKGKMKLAVEVAIKTGCHAIDSSACSCQCET